MRYWIIKFQYMPDWMNAMGNYALLIGMICFIIFGIFFVAGYVKTQF